MRCNYLRNKKLYLNFLLYFWNVSQILNVLKNKMTLRGVVCSTLRTPKTWLDKCLKSSVLEDPSRSNMVNAPKNCWNLHHISFIKVIDHCQVTWVRKSLLLTWKISGLLFNTLTADEKHPVLNRENLMLPIQLQISEN